LEGDVRATAPLGRSARAGQERRRVPRKGDRIELILPRLGVPVRGTVYHVDDLQILVKWDDGRSQGLRPDFADRFRIAEDDRALDRPD
jgi:hypothetical protein